MNKLLEKRLKCSFIMRSLHTLKIEEDQNLTPLHYINHVWVSLLLIWKYKSKKQQQICECRCTEYITIEYIYKYMFCRRKKKVVHWYFLKPPYKTQTKLKGTLVAKSCWTWLNSNCAILFKRKKNNQVKHWNLFKSNQTRFFFCVVAVFVVRSFVYLVSLW